MSISIMQPIVPIQPIDGKSAATVGGAASSVPFADLLGQAMRDANATQQAADEDAYGLIMGTSEDLHSVMIRTAMETAAIETAVELTSRVVGVYKEIMQMQV